MRTFTLPLALSLTLPAVMAAQQASFVYRLGKDTVVVEQYTRTATRLTGELVTRQSTPVLRAQYDITIGADGYPTAMVTKVTQADGSPAAGRPKETRLTFGRDSVRRENVWPDSTQVQTIAAAHAMAAFAPAYGPVELELAALRKSGKDSATFVTIGNGAAGRFTLKAGAGDTVRNPGGGGFVVVLRADRDGKLQAVDGNLTTNKVLATRSTGGVNIASIASKMTPFGPASGRGTARQNFAAGGGGAIVSVDYGRPQVRDRSVWGGVLVPFDSVWRTGANEATHLTTTHSLAFGDLAVPAGVYTLWTQHTRSGTWLIINKQIGVWGTNYDSTQVLGRVRMELTSAPSPVEEFTITVRPLPQNRGALDLAWGPSVATATFTVNAK